MHTLNPPPLAGGPEVTITGQLAIHLAGKYGQYLKVVHKVAPVGDGEGTVSARMTASEALDYVTRQLDEEGAVYFDRINARVQLALPAAAVWLHIVESQIGEDALQDERHGAGTTGVIEPGAWPAGNAVQIHYVRLDNGPLGIGGESWEEPMARQSTYAVRAIHWPGTDAEHDSPWLLGAGWQGVAEALASYWCAFEAQQMVDRRLANEVERGAFLADCATPEGEGPADA